MQIMYRSRCQKSQICHCYFLDVFDLIAKTRTVPFVQIDLVSRETREDVVESYIDAEWLNGQSI